MSTNYYWNAPENKPGMMRRIHIGKSSSGWCFALHVDSDLGIYTLEDWKVLFSMEGSTIENEDEQELLMDAMISLITERECHSRVRTATWYQLNHAVPGPNGLARRRIGDSCSGHGDGTWDLCDGTFC